MYTVNTESKKELTFRYKFPEKEVVDTKERVLPDRVIPLASGLGVFPVSSVTREYLGVTQSGRSVAMFKTELKSMVPTPIWIFMRSPLVLALT